VNLLLFAQRSHDVAVDGSDVISRGLSDVGAKTDLDDLKSKVKINRIADSSVGTSKKHLSHM